MDAYCCDTHALIWYSTADKALSSKARILLYSLIEKNQKRLIVPSIAILEAYHKNLKRQLLDFRKLLNHLKKPNIRIASLDEKVLNACYGLPGKIEIHDRVIAATALTYDCPLITKDKTLRRYSPLKTVW